MSEESEIIEPVEEARKPGVFKIADVLKGRAYPKSEVEVYLNEDVAFLIADIDSMIDKTSKSLDSKKNVSKDEVDELIARREEIIARKEKLMAEMVEHKYVFHIQGISEGQRQDIYDRVLEKFPMEYEKSRNPFSGQVEKVEIESAERDRYFTTLIWCAYITKIVAPDGEEQNGISEDDAIELRRSLPVASSAKISDAIDKIRASTALFMASVNEDFLAKS